MSLSLLTDFYQITMAYSYWKAGMHSHEAVFHLFYRKNPFGGNYALAAGLQPALKFLEEFHFDEKDIAYLRSLKYPNETPLFEEHFLRYLADLKMDATVLAVPEGTPVFPHEPLLRIQGNIVLCQLVETPLLNLLNFHTLIATKAARVCEAARGDTVVEFGLRRAQGQDGALAASRAAFVGGCVATSNVLAGQLYDIPVRGTHAHSWVMSFDEEFTAFESYAQAMPQNTTLLVDTYDTHEGVRNAIKIGHQLREKGYPLVGIRLDSGDLAALSIDARKMLDEAGFEETKIVATNDLDEYTILDLKRKGAKIDTWGVGTKLVTAYDQPALGGVYKLGAIREPNGDWKYRMKLSEDLIKVSNPGMLQVRRFKHPESGQFLGDMIYNEHLADELQYLQPFGSENLTDMQPYPHQDLLVPIFENGKLVYNSPSLRQIQSFAHQQLSLLPDALRGFSPAQYPTGLERKLYDFKRSLLNQLRKP